MSDVAGISHIIEGRFSISLKFYDVYFFYIRNEDNLSLPLKFYQFLTPKAQKSDEAVGMKVRAQPGIWGGCEARAGAGPWPW